MGLTRSRFRQPFLASQLSFPDSLQRFYSTAPALPARQSRAWGARAGNFQSSLLPTSASGKLVCQTCRQSRRQDFSRRTHPRFVHTTPWRSEPRQSDSLSSPGHVADPLVDPSGRWNSQQGPAVEQQTPPLPFGPPGSEGQTFKIYAPPIFRAILFFLGVGGVSYGIAAYASVEEGRSLTRQRDSGGIFGDFKSFVIGSDGNDQRLRAVRKQEEAGRMGERLKRVLKTCESLHLPPSVTQFIGRSYVMVAERSV